MGIGESIKRLRNNALMTPDDLAAAAGVSTDVIRKLEQGRRHTASIRSLHGIAAALDVDLGELLGRESMPAPRPTPGWSPFGRRLPMSLICWGTSTSPSMASHHPV